MRGTTHSRTARAIWPWIYFGGATITQVRADGLGQAALIFIPTMFCAHQAALWPDIEHQNSTITHRTVAGHRVSQAIRSIAGGHRMGTHSIAATLAVGITAFMLAVILSVAGAHTLGGQGGAGWSVPPLEIPLTFGLAVAVGFGSHILGDLLNPQGCALFWPLSRRRIHFMRLPCSPPKPSPMRWGEFLFNAFLVATQILFILKFLEI